MNKQEFINQWGHLFSANPKLFIKDLDSLLASEGAGKWINVTREDAYKEGMRRSNGRVKSIWKAKIFAAGAMWAKMKFTGISDVIGNQPEQERSCRNCLHKNNIADTPPCNRCLRNVVNTQWDNWQPIPKKGETL